MNDIEKMNFTYQKRRINFLMLAVLKNPWTLIGE
jgi:hypothetical protein